MDNFVIAKWLKSPHLQTIGSVLMPRPIRFFPSKDRRFQLPDGSQLVGECTWQAEPTTAPTLVIIAGLNGSTVSPYVRGTTAKAFTRGFNVVRVNLRNGGGSEKYSRTLSHAGQSADIRLVIEELINKDSLPKIGLMGFSYGGNACLKAVGEWGEDAPKELIGAVGISPLIDLAAADKSVDNTAPGIYRALMLYGQMSSLRARNRLFPGMYDAKAIKRIKTLGDYDRFCAPHNGFNDAHDYHVKASARQFLPSIAVPTLIIQSADDVVIPVRSFEGLDDNPNIELVITQGGGHGGFISQSKNGDPDHHWAENRAIEFLWDLAIN
ncbi:MAG: alpha/beta fold hydrolase [Patescibacteria group bacterium]